MSADLSLYRKSFFRWVHAATSGPIAGDPAAFCFNIAETASAFIVELVGAPAYDATDPDWACEEVFAFRDPFFKLPYSKVGRSWENTLALVVALVREYLSDASSTTSPLRAARAVAVGFVDGDLEVVFEGTAA